MKIFWFLLVSLWLLVPVFSQSNWESVYTTSTNLNSVFFINKQIGWVVGENSLVLKTTDGGDTWAAYYGTGADLNSVSFVDSTTGWIVGEAIGISQARIAKSTNGGEDWDMQNSGQGVNISIYAHNENFAWMVGTYAAVLRTTNSGLFWQSDQAPVETGKAIHFFNKRKGILTGRDDNFNGIIAKSTDGGATWTTVLNPAKIPNSISFADTLTGLAVGGSGSILKTTDNGETWTEQTSNTMNHFQSVHIRTQKHALAVGAKGTVAISKDGETWSTSEISSNTLRSVFMVSKNIAFIAGDNGTLLRTKNGGTGVNGPIAVGDHENSITCALLPFQSTTMPTLRIMVPETMEAAIYLHSISGIITNKQKSILRPQVENLIQFQNTKHSGIHIITIKSKKHSFQKVVSTLN